MFLVFLMGLGYTIVFYAYSRMLYFCILITFAFSIAMIFALDKFKCALFDKQTKVISKLLWGIVFLASVAFCFWFNHEFRVDYGFVGCMTPVFVSIFYPPSKNSPEWYTEMGNGPWSVIGVAVGAVLLYAVYGGVRLHALLTVPLLLLYSGKRGKRKTY